MRKYETVVVYHPDLKKEDLEKEIKKLSDLLKSNGAENLDPLHWGRKQLAYLAKKQNHGYYVSFQYESANTKVVNEATLLLRIQDNVLKFQSHVKSDRRRKFQGNPKRKQAEAAA